MGETEENRTVKYVGAIIEHPQKGLLLQQRDERAPAFPLCWTLFGGKVEANESSREAIHRELEEEIHLTKNQILCCDQIQRNIQANGSVQIIYYIKTTVDINDLQLQEGRQMRYVDKKKVLLKRSFAFNIRDVILSFLNNQ